MSESNQLVANQNGEQTSVTLVSPSLPAQVSAEQFDEIEAKLEALQKIDPTDKPSAGILYWECSKGDSIKGLFAGWQMITPKDNGGDPGTPIPAAVVRISAYQCYMSAAVKFVNAFQSIPEGKAVYVECTATKTGTAKDFDVRVLD